MPTDSCVQLPAHCVTTGVDAVALRYRAAVLLLYAMAQAGAATASLVVVPPSCVGRYLALFAQMLGMLTLVHLSLVLILQRPLRHRRDMLRRHGGSHLRRHLRLHFRLRRANPLDHLSGAT